MRQLNKPNLRMKITLFTRVFVQICISRIHHCHTATVERNLQTGCLETINTMTVCVPWYKMAPYPQLLPYKNSRCRGLAETRLHYRTGFYHQ